MAIFEHLRISLGRPSKPPLLEAAEVEETVRPREEYLRAAFSSRHDFLQRGEKFSYRPEPTNPDVLTGFFGREFRETSHSGPDDEFRPIDLQHWHLAFFALDLRDGAQIALMQRDHRIGSPRPILESFLTAIVRKDEFRDWMPHVEYISLEDDYWRAADEYRGRITKLIFHFIPPNALKSEERINDFIRDASEHAKAQTITHEYSDPNGGLDPNGDLIEGSVEIATKGGGEATMKAGKTTVFSSAKSVKKTSVTKKEIPEPQNKLSVQIILARLFGIGDG